MDLKNMRKNARITIAMMGLFMRVHRKMTPIEYEKYLRILRENTVK